MDDPEGYRDESRDRWETAAAGWAARADENLAFGMPVARWLIDAIAPQPGERVVELAAGVGDIGLLVAELVRPGGTVLVTDFAEAMLEAGRRRARAAGADNVEFARIDLEWIDLPTASADAALCRWGYMLVPDPETALRETRRLLRPGGRLALAVWDAPERNPWAWTPRAAAIELGLAEPASPGEPDMFALSPPGRLEELLDAAGFTDVRIDAVDLEHLTAGLDEWWAWTKDLSASLASMIGGLDEATAGALRAEISRRAEPFVADDGTLAFPGRSLVAAASA